MAPKKPDTVIIVSVVISRLCTGHLVSRSRIYSFPRKHEMSRKCKTETEERKVYYFRADQPLIPGCYEVSRWVL
jgi:hypothetical protein